MANLGRPPKYSKDIPEGTQIPEITPETPSTRVHLVDGFIHDLEKFIADLEPGEIPIGIVPEAFTKRSTGRTKYLVTLRKTPGSTQKAKLVFATGIEKLNEELAKNVTTEHTMFFISVPVNKRGFQSQYLVVMVKD
jgi:hypothetical protein